MYATEISNCRRFCTNSKLDGYGPHAVHDGFRYKCPTWRLRISEHGLVYCEIQGYIFRLQYHISSGSDGDRTYSPDLLFGVQNTTQGRHITS